MITAQAEVIAINDGQLVVRCQQQSSCGSCAAKAACGTGVVSSALPTRLLTVQVASEHSLPIGSLIEIGLSEQRLIRAAFLVYVLPLLFALTAALLASWLSDNELYAIFSSLFGLFSGFYLVHLRAKADEHHKDNAPRLLRVIKMAQTNPS